LGDDVPGDGDDPLAGEGGVRGAGSGVSIGAHSLKSSGQRRARAGHVASRRHTDTVPTTPFGMNRIESTRIAPNTGWTRSREIMPAMSGQNWRSSPPATAPHTDVMPPNTEPTRRRIESQ